MTIFGVFLTYACSWWVVLFMVLPWRVKMAENPTVGHAQSAPVNPMLRKKLWMTTLFALIPTAVLYVLIGIARAEEPSIYHAGSISSDCDESVEYQPSVDSDLDANGDESVSADDQNGVLSREDIHVGLNLPASDYLSDNGNNADLRHTDIYMGDVAISRDGKARLNGRDLSSSRGNGKKCK